jgi:sugar phosphate isomerase/epimerase
LKDALAYAKAGGFQGLDVNIGEVAGLVETQGADYVKGLYEEAGLQIGAWGLPVAWNGPEEDYKSGLEKLPALAQAGASVGATRVCQWIPAGSDDRKFRENFRWHVERLKPIGEILSDHGCRLGMEFLGPQTLRTAKNYGFIYTIGGMLALGDAVGTGNMGLLLDCWHWYTGLGAIEDLRTLTVEDVVHVHVNDAPSGVSLWDHIDNQRAMPSETGVIDLVGFLKILREIGYDGPVTPEPFNQRLRELPAEQAVRETHEALDKAWKAAGLS